jgi:protein phosphatase
MFRDDRVFYAHAGDSRLYRLRAGQLKQLTRDHSLIRQLVDQRVFGSLQEARAAGVGDNVLVRSLGMEARVEPDVGDEPLRRGDLYLFCTDGLAGKVPDAEIEALLAGDWASLDGAAEALVEAALRAGGPDNVTVVLVRPGVPAS